MHSMPDAHYRISIKALIIDDEGRVLFAFNADEKRDLIGGGLDHGELPQDGIRREILEETGMEVTWVDEMPFYFDTCKTRRSGKRRSNVYYKVKVKSIEILPTAECLEVAYLDKQQILLVPMYENLKKTMVSIYEKILE